MQNIQSMSDTVTLSSYVAASLFGWLGFDQKSKTWFLTSKVAESKQSQQEGSSTVVLPLKLVFSVYIQEL